MPAMKSETLETVLRHVDSGLDQSRERLFALLRIPSISAQPGHAADCRRAAEWVRDQLTELGFTAALRDTPGHPVVVAHCEAPPGYRGPHVLFYGHYDVQPVDPVELWNSPPFEPQLVKGPHGKRFVARGAVDDKGQTMMFLEALRAWKHVTGAIPAHVTVLIEGEEEVGSRNLEPFLIANRQELAANIAVISDTGMWDIDTPAITTRLRGMAYTQVTLRAASRDLHSGLYGGSALNPINALCRALGELHDAKGRIQVPDFYAGVKEPTNAQAAQWGELGFDENAFLGDIGLKCPVGEQGRPALQRLWARPTADINGIWGGYTGPGSKTVIPAEAFAKVSFRLVPGQDPGKVVEGFRRFLAERVPVDAKLEVEHFGTGSPGIEIATDSPWMKAAQAALGDEFGRPALLMGSGGSIPVVSSIKNVLGIDTLLMGFGLNDDQVHSPNEKFEQRCFHHGIRSHARLLAKFAEGA
jgi:acetylornithine deacetylase/succinyl-diaminopimelate desuccinylase-like protein